MAAQTVIADLDEIVARHREEFRRDLKTATQLAEKFSGCSLEAVVHGLRRNTLMDWERAIQDARQFQADIELKDLEARLKREREIGTKALAEVNSADSVTSDTAFRAWRRFSRSHQRQATIERQIDELWERKSKLYERAKEDATR